MIFPYKIGFIGTGNLTQSLIRGLIDSKMISGHQIYCSNRTPGKLQKAVELWQVHAIANNEELIDVSDVVILAMKPQDLSAAVDPLVSIFREKQVVISLAAGVSLNSLQKKLPQCRVARAIPNTPSMIRRGVIGYLPAESDDGLNSIVEDLFKPLGSVINVDDEEQLEALLVSCSSGTGFIFELMMYFQDWIEERGFESHVAREMVVQTFLGASQLAVQNHDVKIEELQNKVSSRKGVTSAGLESMRELEIERLMRYSFEKASLRNQELAKKA